MRGKIIAGVVLLGAIFIAWGLAARFPFFSEAWRANFQLNASVLPASDDARSQYLAINPGFRVEFGDKENPTSAFLRFEVVSATEPLADLEADVQANLLDSFLAANELVTAYHRGLEWQLFSVGIDEAQAKTAKLLGNTLDLAQVTKEILGPSLIATTASEVREVLSEKQKIVTSTQVSRQLGYDQVENLEVAKNTDLWYTVVPGKGIKSAVVLGDRQDFDTACWQFLSLAGALEDCALPYNRFSFLLQLDPEETLVHSPLSLDGSERGTDYLVDREGNFLLRLGNWQLVDAVGTQSSDLTVTLRPGQVNGEDVVGYYIVTVIADLNWLLESERVFPVRLESGFYRDGQEFFQGEQWLP